MTGHLGGPNSPAQTLGSTTPIKGKYAARNQPLWHNLDRLPSPEESGIRPTDNGHAFSLTTLDPFAQLTPSTSTEGSKSVESLSATELDEDEAAQPVSEVDDVGGGDGDDEEADSDDDGEIVPMKLQPLVSAPLPAPMLVGMYTVPGPAAMSVDGMFAEESDEGEDDSSAQASVSEYDSVVTPPTREAPLGSHLAPTYASVTTDNFILEELSDVDPMERDRIETILPSGVSSPASGRSRSRGGAARELPFGLTGKMRDLNWGLSSSPDSEESEVDEDEAAHREFVRTQRELKMRKRRSYGSSIGKRTMSERSDSDDEDWMAVDADAVGSSARKLRRRVGDRRSFVQLPLKEAAGSRIDEVEEPESEVDGLFLFCDHGTLAQELPFFSIEMEYS